MAHYFNYESMKQLNCDKQMKDVWKLPTIATWKKSLLNIQHNSLYLYSLV